MEFRIVALLALLALSLAHTVKAQEGCVEEEQLTQLDFFNSIVTQNDLHVEGGAIVYSSKYIV